MLFPIEITAMGIMAQDAKSYEERPHVLIVDDDRRIRDLLFRYLGEQGFIVMLAEHTAHAREIMKLCDFDAAIVDVMMPGETGIEFVHILRSEGDDLPVLMLTALGEAHDRITGFESGADDYLPKPFEPRELVLRLQALIRRRPKPESNRTLAIGPWRYKPGENTLRQDDMFVRLTDMERTLLDALAQNAGDVVNRDDLAARCGLDAGERTIDVQVTRLRRKLEHDTKEPLYLQTVRGKGYVLRASYV